MPTCPGHACRYKGSGVQVRRYSRLHHNHAGVVSLSTDGSEVAITTAKANSLDKDFQVTPAAGFALSLRAMRSPTQAC